MTHSDSETKPKSKLLFPGLESFYAVAVPLAWPIVRIAVGWNLLVHGWGKVTRGPSAYVRAFVEQGFDPALPWIWAALIIEFVGGIAAQPTPESKRCRYRSGDNESVSLRDLCPHSRGNPSRGEAAMSKTWFSCVGKWRCTNRESGSAARC